MTEHGTSVLIASAHQPLRRSLRALLSIVPGVQTVRQTEDIVSTLLCATEYRPSLVVLDAGLPGDQARTLLKAMAKGQIRCLVLADDVSQMREIEATGADVVVLKGCPATSLLQVTEELLAGEGVSSS